MRETHERIAKSKNGIYRGFVNDTVEAFEAAGLSFYNEIILINPAGTLPLRVSSKHFDISERRSEERNDCLRNGRNA